MPDHTLIDNVRLPRWLLPAAWPTDGDAPALARVAIERGRIAHLVPMPAALPTEGAWNLQGTLALPGFVDAHTHLDKAFTLPRMKNVQPGLLGAIDAMLADRSRWTEADVRERAARGLQWAWECGSTRVRTHVDWWEPESAPLAWHVMAELAEEWQGRVQVEQVSLIKLSLFEDADQAMQLARIAADTGPQALLGGFVHSTNFSEGALRNLLLAAQAFDLDVDLHVDEELNADARGLATIARLMRELGFAGRVVCGHTCALAAQNESLALATLDAVARVPITLVSLPATNLLLQDAVTGRTPRQRGLTLVKEARERGIPLLFASDNVQDPFCRLGSFDPVEALALATLVAQLDHPFDDASQTVCRADWLQRTPVARPTLVGAPADLVLFPDADIHGWPSRTAHRVVLREGRVVRGNAPAAWTARPDPLSSADQGPAMLHGYIPPHRFLPYLSWTEIDALPDRENTVIVLPCGAIEQHGPHLPCSVDSVISSGVMGKALEKLPADVRAFALPTITYGKSEEHLHFPGTMTLTGTTLLATVIEIGESVYRSGFRKLLFANGHGGQPQVLEMAARELRLRHGDFVVVPHGVSRLPNASSKQISDQEKRLSMHAGHSETALMLALAPDTVHMERAAANFPPPFPIKLLSPDGRPACAWTARDFGPSGVIGDPTSATRAQGEEILDTLSDSWVQALTELYALRWVVRDEPTWARGHETGFIQTGAGLDAHRQAA